MGTVLAGLAESMALAEHIGLDQEEVLKILTLSPVSCPLVRTKGKGKYPSKDPHALPRVLSPRTPQMARVSAPRKILTLSPVSCPLVHTKGKGKYPSKDPHVFPRVLPPRSHQGQG